MSSQADISLETSLSFLPSSSSSQFSSSSADTLASTPNLYVTFKVLQLVNTFRKRVKTRVNSTRVPKKQSSPRDTEDFCQDFERQAFEEIDKYLGRKTVYPRTKARKTDTAKPKSTEGRSHKLTATALEDQAPPKSIEWLFEQINQAAQSESLSLPTVAASDKLFVQRKKELTLTQERLSLKELTELLVTVKDLLQALKRPTPSRGAKTLCEGNEALDLTLDETSVANLEHLLLCLRDQLIRRLVAILVDLVHKHVVQCQRDQNKHCEDWFFEFPDARHPLSTTWPWSIRPSLAVIWGVCWMFYDNYNSSQLPPSAPLFDIYGNMVNEQGDVLLDSQSVEYFNNLQRQQQAHYYTAPNPSQAIGPLVRDPRLPRTIPHSPNAAMAQPHSQAQQFRGLNSLATSHPPSQQPSAGAHASPSLAIQSTNNNTYTAAPSSYANSAPAADANNWLPEENFATHLGFQDSTYAADIGPWQDFTPQSLPEQQRPAFAFPESLPPRARNNPLPPAIRVITDGPEFQQQPQDIYNSAHSASSNSSYPVHENYYPHPFPANAQHLSPQGTHFMHQEQQEMQTPPRSPLHQNGSGGEQNPRKRSHSVMSESGQPQPHSAGSRSGSVGSAIAHSPGEDYSPRRSTIKRPDPPMTAENKYYCDFAAECVGLTFDRKCEWSKHMDKHDRPYRCPHPSCAKLQGFTYSGGLLRHEREVHGKHGGPKAQLMCPHEDCKRHSGKGFTRKENLNEHIRRVHQSKDQQSQMIPLKRDATDAHPGAEEAETPASEGLDVEDPTSAYKRRRYNPGMSERSASEDVEDLKQEIKRLRDDSALKDQHIAQMMQEMSNMKEEMMKLQQNQGQG